MFGGKKILQERVTKLEEEITELMKQTEADEAQVRKGLRTRAQAQEYEIARKSRADFAQSIEKTRENQGLGFPAGPNSPQDGPKPGQDRHKILQDRSKTTQ